MKANQSFKLVSLFITATRATMLILSSIVYAENFSSKTVEVVN